MKLIFASNNKNKIKEIQSLVPNTIQILSLEDIGCFDEIPETANTIEGNSVLKANYITEKYGFNCFADDSGLEVDALNGEPGVFSARYAGEPKNDEKNIEKVLIKLLHKTNRKANFKTVICLNLNDEQHLFTGIINGKIIKEKIGSNGFGYDPIFVPDGYSLTFAELSMEEKSEISHRGIAMKQLIKFLK
jgi:XTP/dITP diphosphohydrolase